jgi:hypothetical protein
VPIRPAADPVADSFRSLHARIYDVHHLGTERHSLHEWLAGSFAGEALTEQYITAYRTARRLAAQDAAVDVRRVEYGDILRLPGPDGTIRLDVRWSVGGVLRHAAHRHARVNQYRAIYEVADTVDGPRIVGARMRSANRLRHPLLDGGAFDLFAPDQEGPGAFLDPADLLDAMPLEGP